MPAKPSAEGARRRPNAENRSVTVRRPILVGVAALCLLALFSGGTAALLWFRAPTPWTVALGIVLLLSLAGGLLGLDRFVRFKVIEPVRTMTADAEAVADRLTHNEALLSQNVRSLERTNRELAEAWSHLAEAERLASVGRLGAGIAHEVGNPLAALIGYLEVARRRALVDGEWLNDVSREAGRIDAVIRGLLDFARPAPPVARPVDLNEQVLVAVELLARQGRFNGIEVRRELAESSPIVRADPVQLEQVLVNLLLNACDAIADTGVSGRISLRTALERYVSPTPSEPERRREDPDGVDYSHRRRARRGPRREPALRDGQTVALVEVGDNGTGAQPEDLELLFEPFYTTKDPGRGTGLGLAVCQRLIEEMGGCVTAASGNGKGTLFAILLPFDRESASETSTGENG